MVSITYDNQCLEVEEGETALSCLSRNNLRSDSSCKAGVCLTCIKQCVEGDIPQAAQNNLKATYKELGYFLPCVCFPESDMALKDINTMDVAVEATILSAEKVSDSVVVLKLSPLQVFDCKPGQYLSLKLSEGMARSYSIANDPTADGYIELHIRKIDGGKVSTWAYDEAKPKDKVHIMGPAGECFYLRANETSPLVLAGVGTGLAPLYAIANDALRNGHTGDITLYHGALDAYGLYYCNQLQHMEQTYSNFTYVPCVVNSDDDTYTKGSITDIVGRLIKEPALAIAYICGDPQMVDKLSKTVFLAGVNHSNIHSDAFIIGEPS